MSFVRVWGFALLTMLAVPSAFAQEEFDPNMFQMRDLRSSWKPSPKTEAAVTPTDCKNCPSSQPMTEPAMRDLRGLAENTQAYGTESPFLNDLKKRIDNGSCSGTKLSCARGLVQIPLQGKLGNIGPCGSHHYRPDPPPGTDAYAAPIANCAFTAVLQEWKKSYCPDRSGCTISWGDASHKSKAKYNGHNDHTDGECIDMRPLRKGAFIDSGLSWKSSDYDREKTAELIGVMKKMGATVVLFNDTRAGGKKASGHSNHIHVCFKNTQDTRYVCNDLKVDGNICPELR